MELMNQPFTGQLGNRLIDLLDSPDFHTLNIVVAFAKNSGVLRIKDGLKKFRERGGRVNVYVGVDLGGTSYEALTTLLIHTDSLNVVHSEKGQTFHTKIYQFSGSDNSLIVVGSHNLTGGGLWTNFESSVILTADTNTAEYRKMIARLNDYIRELGLLEDSFMPIRGQDDIDELLEHGYVFKEVAEQVQRAKEVARNRSQGRLFGNGVPAKLPRMAASSKGTTESIAISPAEQIATLPVQGDQTIWFETRSMTGGSRNILDLSMKSLIERGSPKGTPFDLGDPTFMRGGVEFFGLNPTATSQVKNLIINFDGIDYVGNTILFPAGENTNGTWRLQIKGVSALGVKITEAFRAKSDTPYLVKKLVAFTKITSDYYFMSVFSGGELENFKAASRLLARNGSTRSAKFLGML